MSFIKSLLQKKGVVSIICAVICIIVVAIAYNWRVNEKLKAVSVPYATKELQARSEIKAGDVDQVVNNYIHQKF